MVKLYWDGVVIVSRSGIITSSCVVMPFPQHLSAKSCMYVISSPEFEVVGCEDPVVFGGSCVPKVCHSESLVLM